MHLLIIADETVDFFILFVGDHFFCHSIAVEGIDRRLDKYKSLLIAIAAVYRLILGSLTAGQGAGYALDT